MSALKDRLRSELTAAIKNRDHLRSGTIRMTLAAITNAEVSGKTPRELSDKDVIALLATESKKRREAAEAFDAGNRPELATKERAEAEILADFLPSPLSDEEITQIIADAITRTGAGEQGMKGMGQVMGVVTPMTRGRADGSAVAAEVRRQLG